MVDGKPEGGLSGRQLANNAADDSPLRPDLDLFSPGDRVLLGVSGGADSLAMLHALIAHRAKLGIEVVAAHVHHGMRGEEAEADVAFLRARCGEWGVSLAVDRVDVPRLAAKERISVEEAGRKGRYAAFGRLASEWRCGKVATAHTADDQAETVLLNLFRGTGIDGLSGIPVRRPLHPGPGAPEVVRPLLRTWRAEVEAYCRAHALQPREDHTNRDLRYRRSRIRYKLLPLLAEYSPHVKERLVRLAEQAREEAEILGPEADELLREAERALPRPALPFWAGPAAPALALDCQRLSIAPPALARRALRRVAAFSLELDAAVVERLWRLIRGEERTAVDLAGSDRRAIRRGGLLVIEPRPPSEPEVPRPLGVNVPGVTEAPEFRLKLRVAEVPPPADARVPPCEAILDRDAVAGPLVLRAPRIGDRFRPLGAPGSRLVSDLFTDRKAPRAVRAAWPVVADGAGILWVLGIAVAERVRVHPGTRRGLRLEALPLTAERFGASESAPPGML